MPVVADSRLTPEWLMAYGEQRSVVPGVTEAVLSGREGVLFLSVRDEATGRLVGIARMAIDPGWAGMFAVWVDPAHRQVQQFHGGQLGVPGRQRATQECRLLGHGQQDVVGQPPDRGCV